MKEEEPLRKEIHQLIIDIVKEQNPKSVKQLLKLAQERFPLHKEQIMNSILRLQSSGKISLKKPLPLIAGSLTEFLRSTQAYWYWITITMSVVTTIIVLLIPEDCYPFVYARHILGSIFVLWLPGYAFIRALFPKKVPIPTGRSELDTIERIALSIGMSLALVPITGLFLNYTPWGIRTTPVTIILLTLILIFATIGVIREFKTQTPEKQNN